MVTQSFLKEHFSYDPDTGLFTRIKPTSKFSRVHINDVAGNKHRDGGIVIEIHGKQYKAHRLAWLYMYGEWPKFQIDHINGIRDDNRIANLRDIPKSLNAQNQRKAMASNKSTGVLGVYRESKNRFKAMIQINKKPIYLGLYKTIEEAHDAYLKAKRDLHAACTI